MSSYDSVVCVNRLLDLGVVLVLACVPCIFSLSLLRLIFSFFIIIFLFVLLLNI